MNILKSVTLFIVVFMASCETKFFNLDVECEDCYTDRFTQADIEIKINAYEATEYIWLEVYEGNIDEGDLFFADTALYTSEYFFVDVNEDYSARAVYHFPEGDSIIAIDGTKMRRRFITDECDEDCYIVENEVIDLRLDEY